ncbi:MAG TPA: aldo/keto reductase [Polyangiaceae bacterium]|jgi:aryl-alcohol dehydrogenase-like predicted oxidoreductase
MRKRPLGNTGISPSELALGTWGLSGDAYGPVPELEQDAVIERAFALGITLFDTADSYGKGAMEQRLGRHLGKEPRASFATKIGTDRARVPARKCFTVAFLRESLARSRERLARDVIDIVLLHNPSLQALEKGDAPAWLSEQQRAGKIRAWGVSVGSLETGRAAVERGAQILELVHNAFHTRELSEIATEIRDKNVGILARSVLAHGLLCGQWPMTKEFPSGDHRAERWTRDDLRRRLNHLNALRPCVTGSVTSLRAAALRYVLNNELVGSAVLGPRSAVQLDQLVRDAGKEPPYLSPEAQSALERRLVSVGASA